MESRIDSFPSGMRCFWEISIRSLLRETSQRPLTNISKGMTFLWRLYDVSNTSQKRCIFCDIFIMFQKHLKKDVFCMTSLRRLEHISKKMSFPWRFWDDSKARLPDICDFSKKNTQEMKRFLVAVHRYQSGLPWVSVGWYVRGSLCKLTVVKTQQ